MVIDLFFLREWASHERFIPALPTFQALKPPLRSRIERRRRLPTLSFKATQDPTEDGSCRWPMVLAGVRDDCSADDTDVWEAILMSEEFDEIKQRVH